MFGRGFESLHLHRDKAARSRTSRLRVACVFLRGTFFTRGLRGVPNHPISLTNNLIHHSKKPTTWGQKVSYWKRFATIRQIVFFPTGNFSLLSVKFLSYYASLFYSAPIWLPSMGELGKFVARKRTNKRGKWQIALPIRRPERVAQRTNARGRSAFGTLRKAPF